MKAIINQIRNQSGTTLVESIMTVLIIAIATVMISSAFLTALVANKNTQGEYDRVSLIYDNIELGSDAVDTSWQADQVGSVTFNYGGDEIKITGNYYYDDEQEKIGEFIGD